MSSSHARREPIPARARTFWTRSGSASVDVRARLDGSVVEAGVLIEAQSALERLDHLGAGHEVAQRRQLGEAPEPEALEEPARGAVQDGEARARVAADLLDGAALHQGGQRRPGADTPARRAPTARGRPT